jgi:hypothetical protein
VAGSSDMLTVCIPNDLAAKRGYRQRSNLVKKFGGNRNFKGKCGSEYIVFIRLYVHFEYLSHPSLIHSSSVHDRGACLINKKLFLCPSK